MSSKEFTIEDLRRILRESAGEGIDLNGDILDVEFEQLGYESLALLETGARVGREFGIELDDSILADVDTPREFVNVVNDQLLGAETA